MKGEFEKYANLVNDNDDDQMQMQIPQVEE